MNDAIRITFGTKGQPPFGLYLELLRLGFEVEAKYWEPGMGLCGRVDGAFVRDFDLSSHHRREIRKHVDSTLIEEFGMEEHYAFFDEEYADTDLNDSPCEPWETQYDLAALVDPLAERRAVLIKRIRDV